MAQAEKESYFEDDIENQLGSKVANVVSFGTFGRFSAIIISGIAFVIVARILGPSVYGIYTLAISAAAFFTAVADLGVNTAVNKLIGQYSDKKDKKELDKVLSDGYASVLATGLLFTLILFIFSGSVASLMGSPSMTYDVQVVSFIIVFTMLFSLSYYALISFGKGSYVAWIIIQQSIVQSVISILLAFMGFGALAPILGLMAGYALSVIITLVILVRKFEIEFVKPSLRRIKHLLGFSSPIALYNGSRSIVGSLAPIVLGILGSTIIVGNWGVATRAIGSVSNLMEILALSALPAFSYTVASKQVSKNIGKLYNYVTYFSFIIIVPAMLFVALLSKQLSYTVFSARYALAPSYLSIISLGMLLWVVADYTSMLLVSTDRIKNTVKYMLMISLIEFVSFFFAIPLLGGVGLALVIYVMVPLLIILFMGFHIKRHLGISLDVKRLLYVFAVGLLSAAFILPVVFLLSTHYVSTIIVSFVEQLLLYPILLAGLGAVGKKEIKTLKSITDKIPVMGTLIRLLAEYAEHFVRS